MTVNDYLDYPQIRYGAASDDDIIEGGLAGGALPHGQYAFAVVRGDRVYLARDPLGCNKLFFGIGPGGALVVANRVAKLWRCGVPLSAIASCPPGHVLEISSEGVRDAGGSDLFAVPATAGFSQESFAGDVRATLGNAFRRLAEEFRGAQFVVCLSGGLDSSVIASFAAAHLQNVTAVSFTYLDEADLRSYAQGASVAELPTASDDFRCAAKVAAALGMPLVPAVRSRQAVADAIRPSVQLCQDWRDFNVHCATVNLFLAQDVRALFPGEKVVMLTGDLMNEYVCDYSEEQVDGTRYYKIPRIALDQRRKYFVRGLDAGDREIGVFWAHGLVGCQPFAVLAEHYLRIPAAVLAEPNLKWALNGPCLPPEVAAHVNRAKTRAQVGGKDLGTLGIYHRLGIGEEQLRRTWHAQFPGELRQSSDELIQFGRYKTAAYVRQE